MGGGWRERGRRVAHAAAVRRDGAGAARRRLGVRKRVQGTQGGAAWASTAAQRSTRMQPARQRRPADPADPACPSCQQVQQAQQAQQAQRTMDSPMPRYENMVLASSLDAPRTVMRLPLLSSYSRHCKRRGGGRRCSWVRGLHGKGSACMGQRALISRFGWRAVRHGGSRRMREAATPHHTDTHASCAAAPKQPGTLHTAQGPARAHLSPQVALPELAVGGAAGHRPQQVGVDLNHLLHRLGGCTQGKAQASAREELGRAWRRRQQALQQHLEQRRQASAAEVSASRSQTSGCKPGHAQM